MLLIPPTKNPWIDISGNIAGGMIDTAKAALDRQLFDQKMQAFRTQQAFDTMRLAALRDEAEKRQRVQDFLGKLPPYNLNFPVTKNIPTAAPIVTNTGEYAQYQPPTGEKEIQTTESVPINWQMIADTFGNKPLANILFPTGQYKASAGRIYNPQSGQVVSEPQRQYAPQLFSNSETGEQRWIVPGQQVPAGFTQSSEGKGFTPKLFVDPSGNKAWITPGQKIPAGYRPYEKPSTTGDEVKAGKMRLTEDSLERLYSRYTTTPQKGMVYSGLPNEYKESFDWVKRKAEGYLDKMNPEAAVGQALKDYHTQWNYTHKVKESLGRGEGSARNKATAWLKENSAPVTEANIQAVIKRNGW